MRRIAVLTVAVAILVLAGASVASARTSYCSPTGDFCIGAGKFHGARMLILRTFAHRGLVRVCITHPGHRDCRQFRLTRDRKVPSIYHFERRWRRYFPHRGSGWYYVRFRQSGSQIGPVLSFRVSPPIAAVYVSVNAGGRVLKIKPERVHLVSNENLSGLRWSNWGGKTANATGADQANAPSPGRDATNPVRVQATDRRRCGSKLVYTTIRIYFIEGVPYAGQPHSTKYAYGCPR